jgi:hypothetical protein
MFENEKCCVGLKKDGGSVIPHDPDGWTESVQCEEPVVAMEKYADLGDTVLPVCAKHRPLVQMIYADYKAWQAAGQPL